MSWLWRCDQCRAEEPAEWPLIICKDPETPNLVLCSWDCLAAYAAAKVLIDSAGGE